MTPPISELPAELLVKILKDVEVMQPHATAVGLRLVCRSWRQLINATPTFWRAFTIKWSSGNESVDAPIWDTRRQQAEIHVKHAQGKICSFTIEKGIESRHQVMRTIASMVPWSGLDSVDIHNVVQPFLLEHIRTCSALKHLTLCISEEHQATFENTDEPISSVAIEEVQLQVQLIGHAQTAMSIMLHLLARAKHIQLDLLFCQAREHINFEALDRLFAQSIIEGRTQDLTVRVISGADNVEPDTCDRKGREADGVVSVRASKEDEDSSRSGSVSMAIRHRNGILWLLDDMPLLSVTNIEQLHLHGIWLQAAYLFDRREWPNVTSMVLEHCDRHYVDDTLGDIYFVLVALERSTPPRFQNVEVRGIPTWSGSRTLEFVKDHIRNAIDPTGSHAARTYQRSDF